MVSDDLKRTKETENSTNADDEQEDSMFLPPRSALFPSNKARITRYYYTTLLVVFIALVVTLAVWGMHVLRKPV